MTVANITETSQMQVFASRLRELHSLYTHLTMEYFRLPLTVRRYLYGSDAMSNPQVRAMAEAKFCLAATLQWKPCHNGYSIQTFINAVGGIESKTAETDGIEDELCPLWMNFFDKLVEVDRIVGGCLDAGTGLSDIQDCVETLLIIAETKYRWFHGLFELVLHGGHYSQGPGDARLTESMIFAGWNRFCFKIARGVSLADALRTTIRPVGRCRTAAKDVIHSGRNNKRECFCFVPPANFEPWLEMPSLVSNDVMQNHPQCSDNSPCRRKPDFCPCKARGKDCENGNCMLSGPWNWPCVPKQLSIARFHVPSYGAGHHCVEDAGKAGDLFDGFVFAKPPKALYPLPVSPTATLATYNKYWEMLCPIDFRIAFPTPSFQLYDLTAGAGLPLFEESFDTLPIQLLIELKAKAFFLSGFRIPYDVGEFPVKGAVVVPNFAIFDTGRMEALLQQLLVERERWRSDLLSRRTGNAGYQEPALGEDFVVVAIRAAVDDLIEHCGESLRRARRARRAEVVSK